MAVEDPGSSAPMEGTSNLRRYLRELFTYRGLGVATRLDEVRFRDVAVTLIVALTIWGHVDVARRGRIEGDRPEVHRSDFTVYVEAGAAFFSDRDPYKVMNARGWTYLYPPIFALIVAPLSYLDTRSQVGVWFAISAALGFGSYFEARRIWRLVGASERVGREKRYPIVVFGICAAGAACLPGLDCLQRGQLSVALAYAMLLGYRLVLEGRPWLGGLVLSWGTVVKLIPALPAVFALGLEWVTTTPPASRNRAARATAGVVLGVLLFGLIVPTALIGWRKNAQSLATWSEKVAFNKDPGKASGSHVDSYTNQSLTNATYLLSATIRGPVPEASMNVHWMMVDNAIAARRRADWVARGFIHAVQTVILGLLAGVGLKTARNGTPLGRATAFGLSCMAIPLISPVGWGNYFVYSFPAALFAPRWLWRQNRTRAATVLAVIAATLPTVHYIAMPHVGDYGLLGLGATAWLITVCLLVIRIPDEAAVAAPLPMLARRVLVRRSLRQRTSAETV